MGDSESIRDRIKSLRRVCVSELRAHPKNFRKHAQGQRRAMSAALHEIGFADALLVRETADGLQIIDGHLRADLVKDQKVPVLVLDVDEQEADKLLATFDAITGLAEIDEDILRSLTDGLEFETPELDELVAGLLSDEPADITEDDPPAPQDGPCVAQVGDVWACGRHRVVCGDAGSADDVDRLLEGEAVHLVNTDPPYNVNVQVSGAGIPGGKMPWIAPERGKPGGRGSRTNAPKSRPLQNDFVSDERFAELLLQWFSSVGRVLEPGRAFYIWAGWSNYANYPVPLQEAGLFWHQCLVWVKEWPFYARKDFMTNHEVCFYGWREGAAHEFFGPNNVADVWSIKKITPQSMIHLTEKPVELAARAIQYSSRSGENVLDLFGGSGSTLIACEQLGRRAYIMEIDELYVDVILQRYMNFTNVSPRRKRDGALFSELVKGEVTYV